MASTVLASSAARPIFEDHPELLAGLPADAAESVRRVAVAPVRMLRRGDGRADLGPALGAGVGIMVLAGVLCRRVLLDDQSSSAELLGPGDVLQPTDDGARLASVPSELSWRVLAPTPVAVLDQQFLVVAGQFPELIALLLQSSMERSRRLAQQLAIGQMRRADMRVWRMLWVLAERYGRVMPHGVVLPLRLTHGILGELVCLRRPTVTLTLRHLHSHGLVERDAEGRWCLHGPPPSAGEQPTTRALAFAA